MWLCLKDLRRTVLMTPHRDDRNVSSCFSTTLARQLQTSSFNYKVALVIYLIFMILFLTTATSDVTSRTLILHAQLQSYPAFYKISDTVTPKVSLISNAHTWLHICILYTYICYSHTHTHAHAHTHVYRLYIRGRFNK